MKAKRHRQSDGAAAKLLRFFGALCALAILALNFTDPMIEARRLPGAIFIDGGAAENALFSGGKAVTAAYSGDETLGEKRLSVRLFGLIELAGAEVFRMERPAVIPCGNAVGIAIHTRGVLVVGLGSFKDGAGRSVCPAQRSGLRAGDLITEANGCAIASAEELQLAVNARPEGTELTVERSGKPLIIFAAPVRASDGEMKLGAWVRDSTVGIGTLSFVDAGTNASAALGHAVLDGDTGKLLPVLSGREVAATILGVSRGRSGTPGELMGTFSEESGEIGSVELNCSLGVFGRLGSGGEASEVINGKAAIPLAFPSEVHTGEALLLAQIDGNGPKEYACRIVRCSRQDRPDQKGLVIEITDEALLSATGGIVQGMSGSPIIQDGRLAGVVTHVFINDPTRGYGIYAFWMYESLVK